LDNIGDEVIDIHGHYIIWQSASHLTQIVYREAGGAGLVGVLFCHVPVGREAVNGFLMLVLMRQA
jgi:hypothetical protein